MTRLISLPWKLPEGRSCKRVAKSSQAVVWGRVGPVRPDFRPGVWVSDGLGFAGQGEPQHSVPLAFFCRNRCVPVA